MFRLTILVFAAAMVTGPARAQDWAKAKLNKSSRHQEWVKVKQGDREVHSFVVYPEIKDKATAVVVIHEIFGLTDWARSVADDLAEAGYIAIAPDLLSGKGPKGGGSEEFAQQDAMRAVSGLDADQVTADLNAVTAYVSKLPACSGKVVVAGFCWGGGKSFRFATENKDVKAAFVFYGSGPNDAKAIARIDCPVYGFYGGNDNRIGATLPKSTDLMKAAGKTFEPVTYEDAGHGFMRAGEAPNARPADKKAHDEAWMRWKELLKKI